MCRKLRMNSREEAIRKWLPRGLRPPRRKEAPTSLELP